MQYVQNGCVYFTAAGLQEYIAKCTHRAKPVERSTTYRKPWDVDEKYVDEHTLTTSISRIRSKIEADGDTYIKTVYGMGYQWTGGEKK